MKAANYIGAHVVSALGKLGTIRNVYTDVSDCITRCKVQHFNGEWWDYDPPFMLLEVLERTYEKETP